MALLDDLNVTPQAAISLSRYLRAAYNGAVAQLREDNTDTTQDFKLDSSNTLVTDDVNEDSVSTWLTANSASNAYISIWYDQSLTANNWIQTTLILQPRLVEQGIGGKACAEFDDTRSEYLEMATAVDPANCANLSIVTKLISGTGEAIGLFSAPNNSTFKIYGNTTEGVSLYTLQADSGVIVSSATGTGPIIGQEHVLTFTSTTGANPTYCQIRKNGQALVNSKGLTFDIRLYQYRIGLSGIAGIDTFQVGEHIWDDIEFNAADIKVLETSQSEHFHISIGIEDVFPIILRLPHRFAQPELLIPGRKPVGPVEIDWDNPLTKGLAFCFVFIGGTAYDLIDNIIPSHTGNIRSAIRLGEECFECDGAGDYLEQKSNERYALTGKMTLMWEGVVDVGSKAHHFIGYHLANGGANNPFDFRTSSQATPIPQLVRAGPTTVRTYSAGIGIAPGIYHKIFVACNGDNISDSVEFIVDGVSAVNSGSGSETITATATAKLRIGERADGTGVSLDGTAHMAVGWNRRLPNTEMLSLDVDPYQFLKPKRPPVQLVIPEPEDTYLTPKAFMPELLIPGRKPVGPVEIDWTNPITNGLKFAFYADSIARDLISNRVFSFGTGGYQIAAKAEGMGADGSGNDLRLNIVDDIDIPTGEVTHTYIGHANLGDGINTYFSDGRNSTGSYLYSTSGVNITFGGGTAYTLLASDKYNGYTPCSVTGNSTNKKIFFRGKKVVDVAEATVTIVGTNFRIAVRYTDADDNPGPIYMYLIHDRVLSDAETISLHRDPYQILKPKGVN